MLTKESFTKPFTSLSPSPGSVYYYILICLSHIFFCSYNKISTGAAATKTMLSDAGSRTASAAKNVGTATAKKLGEIRY